MPVAAALALGSGASLPLTAAGAAASVQPATSVAPGPGLVKGTLLIVGGNMSDNYGVPKTFIELAGGPDKKFVIVPTNGGNPTTARRRPTRPRRCSRRGASAASRT